jgi:hypothetical protein
VGLRGMIDVCPARPGLNPHRPGIRIDRHFAHGREVDDQATIAHGVAGDAVASTAHRHKQALLTGKFHRGDDIVIRLALCNERWMPVDRSIPDFPCLFVCRMQGIQYSAAHGFPKTLQVIATDTTVLAGTRPHDVVPASDGWLIPKPGQTLCHWSRKMTFGYRSDLGKHAIQDHRSSRPRG